MVLVVVLVSCRRSEPVHSPLPSSSADKVDFSNISVLPEHAYGQDSDSGRTGEQAALAAFVRNKLQGPYGIFTNLIETGQDGESAAGHEVLSESASLLLRYDVLSGQPQRFDEDWQTAKQTFDMDTGFSYRYSPKPDKRYPVNAAVDDLRIIRSLYEAGKAFDREDYTRLADDYSRRFLKYNVQDGYMVDFYDDQTGERNSFITLCYIDLKTLALMPDSPDQQKLLSQMAEIASGGYISDDFPFYHTRYDYRKKAYLTESVNTVESMLTILALSEVHLERPASIAFIKEKVKAGELYGKYSFKGDPATDIQSTALYAIAAMIGSTIGDRELYEASIGRMQAYQIPAGQGSLAGAFADAASGQAYSFDNLTALLAYQY
ncbi:hypothetical protein GCM10010917_18030 [Paenibacillus physcomitrellae]|uniref:Glycosyl hydrolase n=2 Tax=Paenibacillus physcomitrellae TaxID=1619311 RepID=A0ABQ1FZ99_9BACL|nr:hypothetical protein GCM10010917_18030 [Paenibacillus physcomitrellae]